MKTLNPDKATGQCPIVTFLNRDVMTAEVQSQARAKLHALMAVAEAAEKAVQAMGNNAPGMYELDKALATLAQLQGKASE